MYHTEAFLNSPEASQARATRKLFGAFSHVVHVTTKHGIVELDAADHVHAMTLADHWVAQLGHPSARLFQIGQDGSLRAPFRSFDFRDFSEDAA